MAGGIPHFGEDIENSFDEDKKKNLKGSRY